MSGLWTIMLGISTINQSMTTYARGCVASPTSCRQPLHSSGPLPILRYSLQDASICPSHEPRGRPFGRLCRHICISLATTRKTDGVGVPSHFEVRGSHRLCLTPITDTPKKCLGTAKPGGYNAPSCSGCFWGQPLPPQN